MANPVANSRHERLTHLISDFRNRQVDKLTQQADLALESFILECIRLRELYKTLCEFSEYNSQQLLQYLEQARCAYLALYGNNKMVEIHHIRILYLIDSIAHNSSLLEEKWNEYEVLCQQLEEYSSQLVKS
ncbi:MAG: hypothetical protein LBF69_02845 [Prevotellaceae bacterium]|jgi:hypothetical protein|nr:hypothetical protein [Prevotellaceae bacterium]